MPAYLPKNTRLGFLQELVDRCFIVTIDITKQPFRINRVFTFPLSSHTYSFAVKGKVTLQFKVQKFWISSSDPGSINMSPCIRYSSCLYSPQKKKKKLTLTAKLVTGRTNDNETLGLVLLVELFQTSILLGEATLGGDIDKENDLSKWLFNQDRQCYLLI